MGEGVFFKVLVTGKPTPSLTWYHNEQEVIANYALEIQEDGTLSIATSEVNHSGVYRLVAKNSAGSAAKEVKLLVEPEGKDSTPDLEKEYLQLKPISLEEFGEYVALNHSNGNKIFRDQFQVCDIPNMASVWSGPISEPIPLGSGCDYIFNECITIRY